MDRRQKLQSLLKMVPGIEEVYYQPPAKARMVYPCIRYTRSRPRVARADNMGYRFTQGYEVMVITRDPDSPAPQYIVEHFPMAEINNIYAVENLYHTSITLYF